MQINRDIKPNSTHKYWKITLEYNSNEVNIKCYGYSSKIDQVLGYNRDFYKFTYSSTSRQECLDNEKLLFKMMKNDIDSSIKYNKEQIEEHKNHIIKKQELLKIKEIVEVMRENKLERITNGRNI